MLTAYKIESFELWSGLFEISEEGTLTSIMMKLTQLLNQSPMRHVPNSEEGRTSRRRTPVPTPVLLDEMKPKEEGLMTPHSSEASPTLKTEDLSHIEKLLYDLSTEDLTRRTVEEKLKGHPWSTVEDAMMTVDFPEELTYPEMELIVRLWHASAHVDLHSLSHECFARSNETIRARLAMLETSYDLKKEVLLTGEIVAFEMCNQNHTFCADDVKKVFPEYVYERFRKIVSPHYPYKLRWTPKELSVISEAAKIGTLADDPSLLRKLPFRRRCEVRSKYAALLRKIPKTEITAAVSKSGELIVESEHIELFELINVDLTSNGLRKGINPQRSMLKVITLIEEEIERRGGSKLIAFTDPEKDIIRRHLEGEISSDDVHWYLPFRAQEDIDAQIKIMQLACIRQKKFSNDIERLIYEAEWYSSMTDISSTPGRRSRRALKGPIGFDSLRKEALNKKPKSHETPEERKERLRINGIRMKERAEALRKKKEEWAALRRNRTPKKAESKSPGLRSRKERSTQILSLLEEARYFQSITGDGKSVKAGVKRKRIPTYHLVPEFQDRQKLKSAQKKIEEQKKRRRGRPRASSETPSTEDSDSDDVYKLSKALEEDLSDDEEISPFDPPDICRDTVVPLLGRDLFNDSISVGSLFPFYTSFSPDVNAMMRHGPELPVNNIVASSVIRDNLKSYKSLQGSFPPIYLDDTEGDPVTNPRNIIHIRYLLYPRHTEQFILAKPKSNELDPVFEINKVFQIHYSLYFAHSEALKDVIYTDYCQKLQEAADDGDFASFMMVIDKWNALMLELTPYPIEINPSIDINGSLRCYLPDGYSFVPGFNELNLLLFYLEVLAAGERPPSNVSTPDRKPLERRISQTLKSPQLNHKSASKVEVAQMPDVFVSRFRHLRPILYSSAFINLLNSMTTITRYCVQQLLLRTYSRIVSPESKKLRSYKAFSAEVYGELLPCFVSEVLSKVDLKPHHKFYDLGSGVGNTTFQAALEFGACESGGCEIMEHASYLAAKQEVFLQKQLLLFGLKELNLSLALDQSFVDNEEVRKKCVDCDVLIVNNYLFDFPLNVAVGKLLYGLRPGSKIISLRNFIPPRYKAGEEKTIFDYLSVEKFEMSDYFCVSWTANKVPYYISTVQDHVLDEYK